MKSSRKAKTSVLVKVLFVCLILSAIPLIGVIAVFEITGTSFIRWCLGEPGATQWVNDTAEKIIKSEWASDLKKISSELESDFVPRYSQLPNDPFSEGRLLPVDRLPLKYRKLGGHSAIDPDVIIQINRHGNPTELDISWFHMRQCIIIFSSPPIDPPKGFFVRKIDDLIYVSAGYD